MQYKLPLAAYQRVSQGPKPTAAITCCFTTRCLRVGSSTRRPKFVVTNGREVAAANVPGALEAPRSSSGMNASLDPMKPTRPACVSENQTPADIDSSEYGPSVMKHGRTPCERGNAST